jgi:ABC-type uncharacterized transport system substrate-binding protein
MDRGIGAHMVVTSRFWLFALIWFATLAAASFARAHPHVRIGVTVAVQVERGAVTDLRYNWQFDQAYLDGLKEEFDTDRDGVLSDAELQVWLAAAAKNLETFKSFTHLRQGASTLATAPAREIGMTRGDGGLTLQFVLPLTRPVLVTAMPLQIDLYDATFFTEFELGDGARVTVDGADATGCAASVALAPAGVQQKAISAFMKAFGRIDAKLAPAKAIIVTCRALHVGAITR